MYVLYLTSATETDPTLVEDAVKYIIFLVDADKLFDTALGMYDFSLVLLVAQHSPKKDPREYLPFLRDLRDAGDLHGLGYQKFKIDDYLKKYEKALWGLHEAGMHIFETIMPGKLAHSVQGSAKFDEAMAYVEKHRLYQEALRIWANETDARARLMDIYGEHLFERREFRQAALGEYFQPRSAAHANPNLRSQPLSKLESHSERWSLTRRHTCGKNSSHWLSRRACLSTSYPRSDSVLQVTTARVFLPRRVPDMFSRGTRVSQAV